MTAKILLTNLGKHKKNDMISRAIRQINKHRLSKGRQNMQKHHLCDVNNCRIASCSCEAKLHEGTPISSKPAISYGEDLFRILIWSDLHCERVSVRDRWRLQGYTSPVPARFSPWFIICLNLKLLVTCHPLISSYMMVNNGLLYLSQVAIPHHLSSFTNLYFLAVAICVAFS